MIAPKASASTSAFDRKSFFFSCSRDCARMVQSCVLLLLLTCQVDASRQCLATFRCAFSTVLNFKIRTGSGLRKRPTSTSAQHIKGPSERPSKAKADLFKRDTHEPHADQSRSKPKDDYYVFSHHPQIATHIPLWATSSKGFVQAFLFRPQIRKERVDGNKDGAGSLDILRGLKKNAIIDRKRVPLIVIISSTHLFRSRCSGLRDSGALCTSLQARRPGKRNLPRPRPAPNRARRGSSPRMGHNRSPSVHFLIHGVRGFSVLEAVRLFDLPGGIYTGRFGRRGGVRAARGVRTTARRRGPGLPRNLHPR
jgi:hypothetical protein